MKKLILPPTTFGVSSHTQLQDKFCTKHYQHLR